MLTKIINKLFFKKIVFKIIVVLTFFLGLSYFVYLCSNYRNPYTYYNPVTEYSNIIEFVDTNVAPNIISSPRFDFLHFNYKSAFIKQAQNKHIISGSVGNLSAGENILMESVYACEKGKIEEFNKRYKIIHGYDYALLSKDTYFSKYKISVDCEKAKTIKLAPESFYFIRHNLFVYTIFSFVCIPLVILLLWTALRFIIISPILWIFKKE